MVSISSIAQSLLLIGLVAVPLHSLAQGADLDKKTPNVFVDADVSFAVLRSGAVGGTDFGSANSMAAGVWTGKSKEIGMSFRRDSAHVNFSQTDGSMDASWTDFLLSYRIAWLRPSLILGACDFKADKAGVTIMDAMCSTMGGNLGFSYSVGAYVVASMDIASVRPNRSKDQVDATNKISARTDLDLGVAIRPKFDFVDIMVGYRYRTYHLEVAGDSNSEVVTGPYFGLKFGLNL